MRPSSLSHHGRRYLRAPPSPTTTSTDTFTALLRRSPVLAMSHILSDPNPASLLSTIPNPTLNSLLRALSASHHLNLALRLYTLIPAPHPSPHTSNSLLHSLLTRGRTRLALTLFSRLVRLSLFDLTTLNTLLRGFCSNSLLHLALRLFSSFHLLLGEPPDIISYNTLLNGLCRAGQVVLARRLFEQIPEPNVISYTTLIRGYCSNNLPEQAIEVFDKMTAAGLKPNKITYNTLIQGFCEARRMDLVKQVMEANLGFNPDTCTFNILIASYLTMGRINEAVKVFDRMPEMCVKRDSASYSTIMRALCEVSEFQKVEMLVDELLEKEVFKQKGVCVPLMAAYNPVLEYLCRYGKTNKARMLMRQLLDRRAKVDIVAFKTVILGHCRERDFKEGHDLLLSMIKRDMVPDEEVYITLINGYLQMEKWHYAWEVLERMLNSGHRPRTEVFHLVLAGLLKKDELSKEVGRLIEVMLERNIRQNLNISTNAVESLFRNGSKDKALTVLTSLYDKGYYVKVEKIVKYLCEKSKFSEARELLLFSLERHQRFDAAALCSVIGGLCKTQKALDAFELFYEGVEHGMGTSLSRDFLTALQHELEGCGWLREADFVRKQIKHVHAKN
ncbi:pentatricopeptide repeat-containing protein [Carex littledalei]|uniref:Pentatricopeptide repeat-containing protein n=1 Tax=Carex littledalei TaxID=544730 RepID=A0A833QNY2_9POAL|nr:pentatricopeptide repeat-containing protein [Carex littledalei]